MTVQYNGGELYSLRIGNRELILHKSEIDELQSYDFETGLEASTVSELNDKVEDLEYKIDELNNEIEKLQKGVRSMTRDDLIDSIAQERTDNAEVAELEEYFYDAQYTALEYRTTEELIEIYSYYFDDYEEGDLEE